MLLCERTEQDGEWFLNGTDVSQYMVHPSMRTLPLDVRSRQAEGQQACPKARRPVAKHHVKRLLYFVSTTAAMRCRCHLCVLCPQDMRNSTAPPILHTLLFAAQSTRSAEVPAIAAQRMRSETFANSSRSSRDSRTASPSRSVLTENAQLNGITSTTGVWPPT